jgi:hypothetical protein
MRVLPGIASTLNYGQLVNRQSPLNSGLISWWLVLPQGGKGSTWRDIYGNYHGTFVNSPDWSGATGRHGAWGAIDIATDDRVDCGDIGEMDGAANFSATAWVYHHTALNFGTVFGKRNTNATRIELLRNGVTNDILAALDNGTAGGGNATGASATYTTGRWLHVALTFDGAGATDADKVKIYIDALPETLSFSGAMQTTLVSTTTSFCIGARTDGTQEIDGKIDDVRIWSRTLSPADVTAIFLDSRMGYQTTLNRIRMPVLNSVAAAANTKRRDMMLLGVGC